MIVTRRRSTSGSGFTLERPPAVDRTRPARTSVKGPFVNASSPLTTTWSIPVA